MAVAPVISPSVALDQLLAFVCEELQLTQARHLEAEDRYHKIADWLDDETSFLRPYSPAIYPQGSFATATTIKPVGRHEHDLDMVCEFRVSANKLGGPLQVLDALERRLMEHAQYSKMLKRKKRCVTIEYANEFHLDVLPAKPDPAAGAECLVVPDRKLEQWKASNPRGYASWFNARSVIRRARFLDKAAAATPIPAQEPASTKSNLKLAVQLWKRWRDVHYGGSGHAPRSIILTTLSASHYWGEESVLEALLGMVTRVQASLPTDGRRLIVLNPMNTAEDFSESWDDPISYGAFKSGLGVLRDDLVSLSRLHGADLVNRLQKMFGEYVKSAYSKQAAYMNEQRENRNLSLNSSGVLVVGSIGTSVSRNTFFGEE